MRYCLPLAVKISWSLSTHHGLQFENLRPETVVDGPLVRPWSSSGFASVDRATFSSLFSALRKMAS